MYLICIPNTLRIRPRIHPGYTAGYIHQDTSVSRYTNHPRIHCRIRLDYIAPMYPERIRTPYRPSALFRLGGAACAARGRFLLLLFGLLSLLAAPCDAISRKAKCRSHLYSQENKSSRRNYTYSQSPGYILPPARPDPHHPHSDPHAHF